MTNELPRLDDSSGALVGRLVLLRLAKTWYGHENTRLTRQLMGELPGILLWALTGWKRLRERGEFVQPDSGKDMVGDMEDLASPIGAFVRECCEVGPGFQELIDDLYQRWKSWAESQGHKDAGRKPVFGRNLRAALPQLEDAQQRLPNGDRVRLYRGIRLRPLDIEWE